tara:strand:+ start:58 stop:1359 length:1302 start_codon:yes stop_codon:yes gene_type:complete
MSEIENILLRDLYKDIPPAPVNKKSGLGSMSGRGTVTTKQEKEAPESAMSNVAEYMRKIFQKQVQEGTSIAASAQDIPFDPVLDDLSTLNSRGYNSDDVLKSSIAKGSVSGTRMRNVKSDTMAEIEGMISQIQKSRETSAPSSDVIKNYLDGVSVEGKLKGQNNSVLSTLEKILGLEDDSTEAKDEGLMSKSGDEPETVIVEESGDSGLMTRPKARPTKGLTDDDMGMSELPAFGVNSREFNGEVVDEMVSLEGMGGDDLSAVPTYSYGITKSKADEYNLKPENFTTMREFADAFSDKYVQEKYEANKGIFDKVDKAFHKPLMSYLWNAGSFGKNQKKALNKNPPDVREFITEMRDAVHSEGSASSGLSARRAKEANLIGENLDNWIPVTKVEVSGTKAKPVFKWLTSSGAVVEEYASTKALHPNNLMQDVIL